jgi:glucose-6-phosphate-specific signal transduction histidine kinase
VGVRVDLSVRGDQPRLPAGLDLAAYRVVQEAVTNIIKHAATDHCQVTVAYQEDTLMLEVTDNGAGSAANGGGELPVAGNGTIGMRERAAMYGGEVWAAPLPHSGGHRTRPGLSRRGGDRHRGGRGRPAPGTPAARGGACTSACPPPRRMSDACS